MLGYPALAGATAFDEGLLILAARLIPVAEVTGSSSGLGAAAGVGAGVGGTVEVAGGEPGVDAAGGGIISGAAGALVGAALIGFGSVGEKAGIGSLEASGED